MASKIAVRMVRCCAMAWLIGAFMAAHSATAAATSAQVAKVLGVSVRTLQEWEQGRRAPSGPARMLLAIAHANPQALLDIAV